MARTVAAVGLAALCLAVLLAANTLPALPLLSNVMIVACAPVVAAATKSASNVKRSLPGAKPSAGG